MARRNVGFVDQHIEKVIVGVCGIAMLWAVWFSFGGRFQVDGKGPDLLCRELQEAAQRTAVVVRNKQPTNAADAAADLNDPVKYLQRWFGPDAEGLIKIARLEPEPFRTQPFPPKFMAATVTAPENRHGLARLVAPGIPIVTTGQTVFELPGQLPELGDYDSPPAYGETKAQRNWASVAAQVDLLQQDVNFNLEKYPPGAYTALVAVHLQRMDLNEPWRGWQDVETWLPFKKPERPRPEEASIGVKIPGLAEFRTLIAEKQDAIRRPALPPRDSGDRLDGPSLPYLDKPPTDRDNLPSLVKAWIKLAESAKQGRRPFKDEDLDAAYVLAQSALGVTNAPQRDLEKAKSILDEVKPKLQKARPEIANDTARSPDRLMPILAHDLSMVPGHRYVYRMRYEAYNLFAGNAGDLTNRDDALKVTYFSDWSPPSRPVQAESDTYFFLTKANKSREQVTVTVYKAARGGWRQEDFRVTTGEPIGGPVRRGANSGTDFSTESVCVDIQFNATMNGKTDVAIVYVTKNDGTLREKYLSLDKSDDLRKKLESQKVASRP